MKVKNLIELLKEMPQDATIRINIRQSDFLIGIERVNKIKTKVLGKDIEEVELIGDWRDFELDEEEYQMCNLEYEEEQRPEYRYDAMDKADEWYDE